MAHLYKTGEDVFLPGAELVCNGGGTGSRPLLPQSFRSQPPGNARPAALRRKFAAMGLYTPKKHLLLLLLSRGNVSRNGHPGSAASPACPFIRSETECCCRAAGPICFCVLSRANRLFAHAL